MSDTSVLWEETVQGGATWSHVLKRGTALRITDPEGGANAGALFLQFRVPGRALQHAGHAEGAAHRAPHRRASCSIPTWAACSAPSPATRWAGTTPSAAAPTPRLVRAKYGEGRYQECRNDCHKNALDSFLVELGKWGLGPRDLVPNVNFFSRVTVGDDGGMQFEPGNSPARRLCRTARRDERAGDPQHLPASARPQLRTTRPSRCNSRSAACRPPAPDDPCRLSRPENERGFILTERYFSEDS